MVRITRIQAHNLLSFEEIEVDLREMDLTVLVGPNGSGKTNIFRLVRHLTDGIILYGSPKSQWQDWVGTLDSWRRNRELPASFELDIQWTHRYEKEMLSDFLQMILANTSEISRGLQDMPDNLSSLPGFPEFIDALKEAIPSQGISSEWSGSIGFRYTDLNHIILYFRPQVALEDWEFELFPRHGIYSVPIEKSLSSYSSVSLTSIWLRCLSDEGRLRLRDLLRGNASSESLSLSVSWNQLWSEFKSLKSTHLGMFLLNMDIQTNDSEIRRNYWPETLRALNAERHVQNHISLLTVLGNLLRHCVISEDLLSPPLFNYSLKRLSEEGKLLTSQHLAAHLFLLKNGEDDERKRFSDIQQMFYALSDRQLDVKISYVNEEPHDDADDLEVGVSLIQRFKGDSRSIPLRDSGSGLVEVAYLCAVLNSPDSHVVLLDEPGRSLHPQALLRLRSLLQQRYSTELASQLLVITHSPYLIFPSKPHSVFRVHGSKSGTKITGLSVPETPSMNRTLLEVERHELVRQDRWGRSPNWPSLLFASVILLVDGETELGALPVWYENIYNEPIEAIGASILSLGGKANGGLNIRDLNSFGIPWVMLIDGDSLRAGSGNVWAELEKAGIVENTDANRHRNLDFSTQVQLLKRHDIYVMGYSIEDQFEGVLRSENPNLVLPSELGGSKVIKGNWLANNVSCSEALRPLFERLREISKN